LIKEGDFILDRLVCWIKEKDVYVCRYEELLADPAKVIAGLGAHIGIKLGEKHIQEVISKNSFQRKTSRKQGIEDSESFYRKGIAAIG